MAIGWRERMRASRREFLGIVSQADREIVGIYRRAAEEMARQARNARSGSLTERWLTDYSRSLTDTVGQMRRDIYGVVTDGMAQSAAIPAKDIGDWMDSALRAAGMDAGASFTSVFSRAPTEAIRSIIEGRMYRDGVSLSRRIWNETGRLQWGIEDVITQGLAQQQGLKEISRALETYLEPGERAPIDIRRLYPNMGEPGKSGRPIPATYQIEYNSMRLARTAFNHAHWGANKAAASLNPLCSGMLWVLSDSHFERQIRRFGPDICDEYVAHDEGLGAGVFPVDQVPLPHPQCLCRQEQVVPTIDDAVARLNNWPSGGSDPALDRGFAASQRKRLGDTITIRNAYGADEGTPITNRSRGSIEDDVVQSIRKTEDDLTTEYPILKGVVDDIFIQDEPDIADFSVSYNRITGEFRTYIRIDPGYFRTMKSLGETLQQVLESGHSKGINNPMTIFAHEYGHVLHTVLALKDIGYDVASHTMSPGQFQAFLRAREQIAQDVFSKSGVFDGEEFGTVEGIYQAIEDEMGRRSAEAGGEEFIEQVIAMGYNGTAGPIARAITKYLKGRM